MSDVKFTPKMPDPPVELEAYDSGDVKQVKQRRQKAANKDTQRKNDMKTLLSMPEGRRILTWILELTGPYRDIFSTNALTMGNLSGQRVIGLKLTDAMAVADPEAWVAMQLEILNPNKEGSDV